MRLTSFRGVEPKTPSQNLEQYQASFAEDVDLVGGKQFRPWRALGEEQPVVDVYGAPFVGAPQSVHYTEGVWVGFDEFVTTATDPRLRAGEGSFLYAQGGRLWRSSARWVVDGQGPVEVGIQPPTEPPEVSVQNGGNGNARPFPDPTCNVVDTHANCNDTIAPEARSYVITYVNCMDEESAPSPMSEPKDVQYGDAVALADPNLIPQNAEKVRYYRTLVGSKGKVSLLFVGESEASSPGLVDKQTAERLGDPLMTERHYPPMTCVEGVADLGDNLTVIWSGREFWVSEPYLPHAYQHSERYRVDYDIVRFVGVETGAGGNMEWDGYILTKGTPYLYSRPRGSKVGTDARKGSYGPTPFALPEPCVSRAGVVSMEGGVVYVSDSGLVRLTGGSQDSLLDSFVTDVEWSDLGPSTMALVSQRGMLFGFSKRRAWVIPMSTYVKDRSPEFTWLSMRPSAAHADTGTTLSFAFGAEDRQAYVQPWAKGTGHMRAVWQTKDFAMPGEWEAAAMKLVGAFPKENPRLREARRELDVWKRKHGYSVEAFLRAYPQYEEWSGLLKSSFCPARVQVFCDDYEVLNRVVRDNEPFRIPHKQFGINWRIRVSTGVPIYEVHMENSADSLTKLGQGIGNSRG